MKPNVKKMWAGPALKAKDVMTRPVEFVNVGDSIEKVSALFTRNKAGAAPVVGANGQVVGVIAKSDIVRYEAQRRRFYVGGDTGPERETIETWMTPTVVSVRPEATLADVVRRMTKRHLHHLLVRDPRSGALRGLISAMDVVRAYSAGSRVGR